MECIGRLHGYNPPAILLAIYWQEKSSKKRVQILEKFEKLLFCQNLVYRSGYSAYQVRTLNSDIYMRYSAGQVGSSELIEFFEKSIENITREFGWSEIIGEWVKGVQVIMAGGL